jgi:hypothetical protein
MSQKKIVLSDEMKEAAYQRVAQAVVSMDKIQNKDIAGKIFDMQMFFADILEEQEGDAHSTKTFLLPHFQSSYKEQIHIKNLS